MANAEMHLLTALARLGLALLLGSAIGFERQWHQKMAGLRTNALVALGACGFVVFSAMTGPGGDPTRVAAQVVSGIGFLGAGIILRQGINVHGLNTAATLWCSAMVGTFAGGGFWVPSIIAAGFVIVTNLFLRPLVQRLNRRVMLSPDAETYYSVEITCKGAEEADARDDLRRNPRRIAGRADHVGEDDEAAGAERDQRVGPEPRHLLMPLPLEADRRAEHERKAEAAKRLDQIRMSHRSFSPVVSAAPARTSRAGSRHPRPWRASAPRRAPP